jgi:integrase
VLFKHPDDGKRRPIRLGHVNKRTAEEVRCHVEKLVSAALMHHAPPDETSEWVAALPNVLRKRLAAVGLVDGRGPERAARLTLKPFLDAYMEMRTDLKESTRVALNQTVRYLIEHFGADKPLPEISPGCADEWRLYLVQKGLAEATVRRRCGAAKQIFKWGTRKRFISGNPFTDLKSANLPNPAREFFVTRDMTQKVINACPDGQWRLIFALARYGGLRCVSEVLGLKWADINWAEGRFMVRSPKTEHHTGHASRQVPLFPELVPFLREGFEQAEPGTEYVITRYRWSNLNLSTQLRRIIRKAGLELWPRLFQNLRASRETELAADFPLHVVCQWIGNSQPVAARHYLQVLDSDFQKAARALPEAARKAAQTPAGLSCPTVTAQPEPRGETASVASSQGVPAGDSNASTYLVGVTVLSAKTSLS